MKTKSIFSILILTLICNSVKSQPSIPWTYETGSCNNISDYIAGISYSAAGPLYVAGMAQYGSTSYSRITVKKIGHLNGITQQTATVAPLMGNGSYANVTGMVTDASGNMYVLGTIAYSTSLGYQIILIKFNTSLVEQWRKYLGSSNSINDYAQFISIDAGNNIYVLGNLGSTSCILAKYNSAGTQLYQQNLNSGFKQAKPDAGGNVYLFRNVFGGTCNDSINIEKRNAAGGLAWSKYYQRTFSNVKRGSNENDLYVNGSRIYITGYANDATVYTDAFVLKYTSAGTLSWEQFISGTGTNGQFDIGQKVAADASNNVYIAGMLTDNDNGVNNYNAFVSKLNDAGTIQYTKKYLGANNASDKASDIKVTNDNKVYLLGKSGNSMMLLRYVASSGYLQWSDTYHTSLGNSSSTSYAENIALRQDSTQLVVYGNNFLTGCSAPYSLNDFGWLIRKYDPANPGNGHRLSDEMKNENADVTIYPNPAHDFMNLDIPFENATVQVYNMTGQLVKEINLSSAHSQMDISHLENAMYMMQVTSGENKITKRLVKN